MPLSTWIRTTVADGREIYTFYIGIAFVRVYRYRNYNWRIDAGFNYISILDISKEFAKIEDMCEYVEEAISNYYGI
jgi:hypothetical protein